LLGEADEELVVVEDLQAALTEFTELAESPQGLGVAIEE
jgi:hypothetical protein